MKTMFRFFAMTAAALTLCMACEKASQEPEKTENFSIDGKQWSFTWEAMGVTAMMDFGVTEKGVFYLAVDGAPFGMSGFVPYASGKYTIVPTDGTSGKITVTNPNDPSNSETVITYTDLNATSVKVTLASLGLSSCEMTLKDKKVEIEFNVPTEPENPGDDQDPEEDTETLSIDGKQWSFTWEAMNVTAIMDFGVTKKGSFYLAVDGTVMGMTGYVTFAGGNYTITPTDATSGKIGVIDPNDPTQTESFIIYTDLTATSVKVTLESMGIVTCEMTLVENKIPITTM